MQGEADEEFRLIQIDTVGLLYRCNQMVYQVQAIFADIQCDIVRGDALIIQRRGPAHQQQRQFIGFRGGEGNLKALLQPPDKLVGQLLLMNPKMVVLRLCFDAGAAVLQAPDGNGDVQQQIQHGVVVDEIMVFLKHGHHVAADLLNVNGREGGLKAVDAGEGHTGFVVQKAAEESALVALTALQHNGIGGHGQRQVKVPDHAAHFAHKALEGGGADINLVAKVIQIQPGAGLHQTVQNVAAALLGGLWDFIGLLIQRPAGNLGRNPIAGRGGDNGIRVLIVDCGNVVVNGSDGYPQNLRQLGGIELLILGQQRLNEDSLFACQCGHLRNLRLPSGLEGKR